jgi:hypothetical protein
MYFEDFLYFSKHSIQINVGEKTMYARWTNFMNIKMKLLKRVNKRDFSRIYRFFLDF